ncbi:FecCD family ABC transporter permease [Priestia endophytica]|jgi:iron complex transport system permease protein|uniref:FecCD family ABC transporter permease n=1 Tax=Priestia endophytica TaxID=135735 RepID=UPI000DCA7699|nr:iron ABC transporter permease [Priestia endophytica]KAB2495495.1 iron ABC transporter permease [Priestia endophytica]RAS75897.1 iron ABC transporter [Priestia endophytica]RAS90494.1 iron ABC transporter [Priestia endophytica]
MNKKRGRIAFTYKMIVCMIILIGIFIAGCVFGAAETTIKDVWLAFTSDVKNEQITMLREIRLPREVAAVLVGSALAVAGAIMQGLTRNPLADPGLLGLTAGANAALAIAVAFIPGASYMGTMVACFIGAAVGSIIVFGIGSVKGGRFSPLRIVLAGAAVSAFLYAVAEGVSLYFKTSKDVSMWTSGGMIGTTWTQIKFMAPVVIIGILLSLLLSKQLTILSLSEEVAVGLGQKIGLIKGLLFIVIILLAGAAVSLVGNMVFIGLMVPHIVRTIVGTDYRFILPVSAVVGAAFLVLADLIGRTISAPYETPVTAVVTVIGLPFFLFIVRKGGGKYL